MKIESCELFETRFPMKAPFKTSFGAETSRRILLVKLQGEGITAWGECTASDAPLYSYETVDTCYYVIRTFLLPAILGKRFADVPGFRRTYAEIKGHHMAKAALEHALWDGLAKEKGVSLSAMMGGTRSKAAAGISIGIQESIPMTIDVVGGFLAQGFQRIKLKIMPGWDVELIREVRRHFPHIALTVDANSAYTLEQANIFRELDEFGLLYIEQPLAHNDLIDHAALQAMIKTDICLDESIESVGDARKAFQIGAGRVVNIKSGRVGGGDESIRIHNLAQEKKVPVWCGGMLETGIGRAYNLGLASLPNFRLPADISPSFRFYVDEIVDPPLIPDAMGEYEVPQGVGIGVEVQEKAIQKRLVRHERVAP
ncbi:MAG: o-succinylbenzoate synthase [Desulfobacterales bacterium]|jgi:O-succinylbenzoate synthase|nr:o-succinylbenzoate synthase [Desulfobacterales bacterium]